MLVLAIVWIGALELYRALRGRGNMLRAGAFLAYLLLAIGLIFSCCFRLPKPWCSFI